MKNNWVKQLVPHVIAVVVFVVVSLIFCKPVLEGNVLNQHDIVGWKGAAQNALDVKAKTGTAPLWNTGLFSGMPNYQIYMEGKSVLPNLIKVFGLGLPNPANFFFIACICFYILALAMGLNPVVAVFGALAYGFSTYNPVILSAGHETKMYAIGFMPLLLAGLLLIFNKRYWIGLAVATLGAYQELMSNHPQINYYFFIIAAFIILFYLVRWVREKDFKHIIFVFVLSTVAALAGLGSYYQSYAATKEYTEFTMRGGKSVEIKGDQVTAANTKGLDEDYAFSYSMKMPEPLVMLMPNAYGGSSAEPLKEKAQESIIERLTALNIPQLNSAAPQMVGQLPGYWGGMAKPGESNSGPPYVGAIICLLALIGFAIVKGPLKWGLLVATVLGIVMSWGSYFSDFNLILLHNLPLYNKFRAPSMALVIPQLTLVVMAVVTVQQLFFSADGKQLLQQNFKRVLYVLGGLIVVIGLVYIGQSYTSGYDELLTGELPDQIKMILIGGLKSARQSLFLGQLFRTVLFAGVLAGILYLFVKGTLKPALATGILLLVVFIDLWAVDKKYLTDENYVPKETAEAENFVKTAADEQILKDKDPHFRVFDVANGFNSNHAAYFHRSILGYHPAKLRIYQDIIERYFGTGQPPQELLNALDTRYIITQNQQGQVATIPNPGAYGAAWFVKGLKPEADAARELQAVGNTQLKDTAIVPQAAVSSIGTVQTDTTAKITLVKYTNDAIEYTSTSNTPQFAVFSEVYYPAGWRATVDGKETPIIKANYFMRGLLVPAGKHTVNFDFEPATVKKGITISYVSSVLIVILVLGGFGMQWWLDRKTKNKVTV
ncbi:YfhO family protein [Niabella beijingensis]|uniref:YfhO family protein n=1 Tax=Niabella beijingensis TaxID=2872700 RepID=UPI001CC11406|nr:YfhO family protein [Niabella beijingensis]MBZ4191091.1 YfhO family protein [Niabella beijingensis]